MKKAGILLASLFTLLFVLAGCGNKDASSQPGSSSSSSSSQSETPSTPAASSFDVDGMLDALIDAAGLGGTIEVSELDLKASGISVDKLVDWAGAESKTSSENGGFVLVLVTEPGSASAIASELEAFRDARANDDRYAEFENARENTSQARIVENGDCVVYAVSSTGTDGYTAIDNAVNDFFA